MPTRRKMAAPLRQPQPTTHLPAYREGKEYSDDVELTLETYRDAWEHSSEYELYQKSPELHSYIAWNGDLFARCAIGLNADHWHMLTLCYLHDKLHRTIDADSTLKALQKTYEHPYPIGYDHALTAMNIYLSYLHREGFLQPLQGQDYRVTDKLPTLWHNVS